MTSDARGARPWVVLKFGGTSVSNLGNWRNIVSIVRERLAEGAQDGVRILVVHSAVSGITDRLERLLAAALAGEHAAALAAIVQRHRDLAAELGVGMSPELEAMLAELEQVSQGIALMHEISDRTRARVMASGELMATDLGVRFLKSQGIDATWWDARDGLHADERDNESARASLLSTTCDFSADPALAQRLAQLGPVVLTQGFIASNADGDTVLLGRGGSDTSAAYFAAKLQARRLEIWTDVPGMFSANPRSTPTARLLRALHFDEAQEIASSGAKVLHPRCILPVRQAGIPLFVYATQTPKLEGTHISGASGDGAAQVKAVCVKKGITLIAMDSPGMWHEVGFLADAFNVFRDQGLSVDLVSTSETNVTVSLDPQANTLDAAALEALVHSLGKLCRVQVIGPCASVSLVGRNIRAILHRLGDAFSLFEEQRIYLVSQAANDLNFTFVVDEDQADRLVEQFHELLIRPMPGDKVLGPTWEQLFARPTDGGKRKVAWWEESAARLIETMQGRDSAYVYHRASLQQAAKALRGVAALDRVFYAMKANPHAEVLQILHAEGVDIECVSRGEVEHARKALPGLKPEQILFTPNFAPRAEYAWALEQGLSVTIDNLYVLASWGELFKGRDVFVRVDTGQGRGHHQHVRTAGTYSKFGVPLAEMDELQQLAMHHGARIVGLHAHAGSGVFDIANWTDTAQKLGELSRQFTDVRVLDIGGGFGVPDTVNEPGVDLEKLNAALQVVRQSYPHVQLWTEPGRYLVATAGVLLARVTQLKVKGEVGYLGVATGMNSLIRPALYGAHHEIVNLTRLEEESTQLYNVVGPICESADVLGHERPLPPSFEDDVLLIANAGAYGHSMSSRYNLREPASELML